MEITFTCPVRRRRQPTLQLKARVQACTKHLESVEISRNQSKSLESKNPCNNNQIRIHPYNPYEPQKLVPSRANLWLTIPSLRA